MSHFADISTPQRNCWKWPKTTKRKTSVKADPVWILGSVFSFWKLIKYMDLLFTKLQLWKICKSGEIGYQLSSSGKKVKIKSFLKIWRKMSSFGEMTAFYISIIYRGLLLRFHKMTLVVWTKLWLFLFKAMYGPEIHTPHVKWWKLKAVTKFVSPVSFNGDVINNKKNLENGRIHPLTRIGLTHIN